MSSVNLIKERVDPRIKRTRRLILQAFSDTLAEKGFQSISVQDITERAGINRTTFYLHFPDKFTLLDTSINHMFQGELEKRTLNTCQFSHENLRSLIITVAEFIARSNAHCVHADQQFETLVETRVKQQVFELLQLWGEKAGRSPEDSRTAAVAASWAIYGLALEWSHDRQPQPVEALAGRIAPLINAILGFEQPENEMVPGG